MNSEKFLKVTVFCAMQFTLVECKTRTAQSGGLKELAGTADSGKNYVLPPTGAVLPLTPAPKALPSETGRQLGATSSFDISRLNSHTDKSKNNNELSSQGALALNSAGCTVKIFLTNDTLAGVNWPEPWSPWQVESLLDTFDKYERWSDRDYDFASPLNYRWNGPATYIAIRWLKDECTFNNILGDTNQVVNLGTVEYTKYKISVVAIMNQFRQWNLVGGVYMGAPVRFYEQGDEGRETATANGPFSTKVLGFDAASSKTSCEYSHDSDPLCPQIISTADIDMLSDCKAAGGITIGCTRCNTDFLCSRPINGTGTTDKGYIEFTGFNHMNKKTSCRVNQKADRVCQPFAFSEDINLQQRCTAAGGVTMSCDGCEHDLLCNILP